MTIADELSRLQELRVQGALTDAEFAQAKAALLASYSRGRPAERDAPPSASLDDIHFQNELARLDREWELEREKLMVTERNGGRHIPTEGSNLIFAVIVVVFGSFWTIMASYSPLPFLPLIGVLFTFFMLSICINGFTKAGEYKKAEQAYQERRAKLLAQRPGHTYDTLTDRRR
jgi:pentatricopeptide repeat protein